MNTQNLSTLKIHKLTQAQYDRELAAGRIDENALYLTPDEEVDLSGYALKTEVADKEHSHNSIVETNNNTDQNFWCGTKAEYDAIDVKDANTIYVVTDENGGVSSSSAVSSIFMTDTSTGAQYKLCVTDGKLNLILC